MALPSDDLWWQQQFRRLEDELRKVDRPTVEYLLDWAQRLQELRAARHRYDEALRVKP